jgi:uncharacterized damage-inducible protein DinB
MNTLEYCVARRKAEQPKFVNVLKAVPQAKLSYKPEPKARSAAELAWVMAAEETALLSLIEKGSVEWKDTPPPSTIDEIVKIYERDAAAVNERLAKLDEAAWQKRAAFLMDGKEVWSDTMQEMVWGFLFDAIHHRGQLSTYLRPMGSKVPSIYGPSADDTGQ